MSAQAAWLDAFNFLESENDAEGVEALAARIVQEHETEMPLLMKVVEWRLRNHDRVALVQLFQGISKRHACLEGLSPQVCGAWKQLWVENLDSLLFFEDSASKLERLRRSLEAKDCASAGAVLKDLQAREGEARPVLEAALGVAECKNDNETLAQTQDALKKLRMF